MSYNCGYIVALVEFMNESVERLAMILAAYITRSFQLLDLVQHTGLEVSLGAGHTLLRIFTVTKLDYGQNTQDERFHPHFRKHTPNAPLVNNE